MAVSYVWEPKRYCGASAMHIYYYITHTHGQAVYLLIWHSGAGCHCRSWRVPPRLASLHHSHCKMYENKNAHMFEFGRLSLLAGGLKRREVIFADKKKPWHTANVDLLLLVCCSTGTIQLIGMSSVYIYANNLHALWILASVDWCSECLLMGSPPSWAASPTGTLLRNTDLYKLQYRKHSNEYAWSRVVHGSQPPVHTYKLVRCTRHVFAHLRRHPIHLPVRIWIGFWAGPVVKVANQYSRRLPSTIQYTNITQSTSKANSF